MAQYGPAALDPDGQSHQQTVGEEQAVSSENLPFTGYALLFVIGIGLCLLSVGVVLRRRAGTDRT